MRSLPDRVLGSLDEDEVLELAQKALRIPSRSGHEHEVARFFAKEMEAKGMEVELQRVPATYYMSSDSLNAIGRIKGKGGGASLILNGHTDHNPVAEGWTKDPFSAVVEDGWLYGFVHMKATCGAYIAAASAVLKAGVELKGDLILELVAGELVGGAGTKRAVESGIKADYFIVGEPTELEIGLAHAACILVKINTIGQMKHYVTKDTPDRRGVNAIEKMCKVVEALGRSHTPLPSKKDGGWLSFEPRTGFEGLPQLSIGAIRGAISRNFDTTRPALLPDFCSLTVDIRIHPGISKESLFRDLKDLLEGIKREDPDFRYEIEPLPDYFPHPFEGSRQSYIFKSLSEAHRIVTGVEPAIARDMVFAGTDSAWLAREGMQGLIYAPAGKYLSRPDERCTVDELITAAKVYALVIADICSRPRAETMT